MEPRDDEGADKGRVEGERGEIAPVPPILDERDRSVLPVVAQQHWWQNTSLYIYIRIINGLLF